MDIDDLFSFTAGDGGGPAAGALTSTTKGGGGGGGGGGSGVAGSSDPGKRTSAAAEVAAFDLKAVRDCMLCASLSVTQHISFVLFPACVALAIITCPFKHSYLFFFSLLCLTAQVCVCVR